MVSDLHPHVIYEKGREQWLSDRVRLEIKRSLVRDSPEVLCCVLEQVVLYWLNM